MWDKNRRNIKLAFQTDRPDQKEQERNQLMKELNDWTAKNIEIARKKAKILIETLQDQYLSEEVEHEETANRI